MKRMNVHYRSMRLGAILLSILSLNLLLGWDAMRGDSQIIQTIAGNGIEGFSGDGGPAIEASLRTVQGLALDAAGNLYIADVGNHVIRRVDTNGIITTVAGLGPALDQIGFNGDNQPAVQAKLAAPTDVALDAEGNLYIADSGNHRIRRVDRQGIITTVAGTGVSGFSGDGGPATAAKLRNPSAIALDAAGNLYIGEAGNFRIRRVDRATGTITTIAGSGAYGFGGDGGPAISARFKNISDLVIGPTGDIFVADSGNHRIRRISSDGIITTVAGRGDFNVSVAADLGDGGPATEAIVRTPFGLALDAAGQLYIAENSSHRIRRVDGRGIITTVAGSGSPLEAGFAGDGGPADQAKLNRPSGVLVDAVGNIYISDSFNFRIRRVNGQ